MTRFLRYSFLVFAYLFCLAIDAQALKYTSIASGNFSSSSTWSGGSIPPSNFNTGDTIVIENGNNVILDQDITFTQPNALLDVRGILRSSGNQHINFNGSGSLFASGTLDIDSVTTVNLTNANITGQCTIKKLRVLILAASGNGTIAITDKLYVIGNLSNTGGNTINIAPNVEIIMSGGQIVPSGTGIFTLPSAYDVVYNNSAHVQPTGMETSGPGLRHVTIDLISDTSELKLGSDLNIGIGTLTLARGILSLNNHNLRFGANGDLAANGTGKLKSTSASNVEVNTSGVLSGQLQFASNGNTVGNLVINSGGTVKLGSPLKVTVKTDLQNGKLDVQGNKLSLVTGATITGADAGKYIITGVGGSLAADIGSGASFTYHIGTSAQYAPCIISSKNNTVYNGMSVGVNPGVKVFGTSGNDMAASQPIVNATWFVEHISTTVDIDMELMWNGPMEVNNFDRSKAYIAHLIGNYWDSDTIKSATLNANGHYAIKRMGIASLSPFAIFDQNTVDVPDNIVRTNIKVYPNPATDILHVYSTGEISAAIFNIHGQLSGMHYLLTGDNVINISQLPSGSYFINLYGNKERQSVRFIKQ